MSNIIIIVSYCYMLYEYYTEDSFERLVKNTSPTRFISLKFILKVVLNNL